MKDDVQDYVPGGQGLSGAQLVDRFPLAVYLRERGFEAERGEREWIGQCPHCQKAKITVNVEKKQWHCWSCQQLETVLIEGKLKTRAAEGGGGLVRLIQWLEGVDRRGAFEVIKARASVIDSDQLDDTLQLVPIVPSKPAPLPAGARLINLLEPLHPYLTAVGLTALDVRRYGLMEVPAGLPSRYSDSLIYPVWGPIQGAPPIYWQARLRREALPAERFTKTLNPWRATPEQLGAGDVLFNAIQAGVLARSSGQVVLTEGPKSGIFAGLNAVASFGKSLSDTQLSILVQIAGSVVVLYDGPKRTSSGWTPDALAEAVRVARRISAFRPAFVARLPFGDPADHPRWVSQEAIRNAPPVQHFDLVA